MRLRDRMALGIAPIFLRAALGVTLLWAGLGNFMADEVFTGSALIALVDMGVVEQPMIARDTGETEGVSVPESMEAPRLHAIAVLLRANASPEVEGAFRGVPAVLGTGRTPVTLAYAVAVTEIVVGCCLLAGLITRIAAGAVVGVSISALWLTEFVPAIRNDATHLGFIPAYEPFDLSAWSAPLWHFSLLAGGLTLIVLGSGALSLDRIVFGPAPVEAEPDDSESDDA